MKLETLQAKQRLEEDIEWLVQDFQNKHDSTISEIELSQLPGFPEIRIVIQ